MAKQETPKDINIFLSDYFKAVATDDVNTRNELLEKGKDMEANFTDLSQAFHTFVSTVNPQIDFIHEINNTKFDILVNVLKESGAIDEKADERLKGLIENLNEVIDNMANSEEDINMLAEVYKKETDKGEA